MIAPTIVALGSRMVALIEMIRATLYAIAAIFGLHNVVNSVFYNIESATLRIVSMVARVFGLVDRLYYDVIHISPCYP